MDKSETPYIITLDQTRTLTNDPANAGLTVETDHVRLNLAGQDLTLEASGATRNLILGSGAGHNSRLVIEGGGTLTVNNISMGSAASTSVLTVTGENTLLTLTSTSSLLADAAEFGAADNANVTVNVENNATFRLDGPRMALGVTGSSNVTVNVSNGGTLDTRGGNAAEGLYLGRNNSGGVVTLNVNAGGIVLTDGVKTARRVSRVDINVNGGSITSTGTLSFGDRAPITTVTISNGGTWTATTLRAGDRAGDYLPRTNMIVDGENSLFRITGTSNLGEARGLASLNFTSEYARLTVRNGGHFEAQGALNMHYSARVTIDDGQVTANSLRVFAPESDEELDRYANAEFFLTLHAHRIEQPAQFVVTNEARLDNFLEFRPILGDGYTPTIGDTFNVMSYGTLTGYFLGLEPNSTVTFEMDEVLYELDYGSEENKVITLTVIPEPHTIGLLLSAGLLLALRRRA